MASMPANMSFASSTVVGKTPSPSRFSPDVLIHLDVLKDKEEAAALAKEGTVTVEELGEVPTEADDESEDSEDR